MIDFIVTHPTYILFVLVNIWVVIKIIITAISKKDSDRDDDHYGGESLPEVTLDLPPGVCLPLDTSEPATKDLIRDQEA